MSAIIKGAVISPCQLYRYALWRYWESGRPILVFVMLNPSTADAEVDDPTILRCCERARRDGYGGILVVNLFGLRATDPKELFRHADPVGPDNDEAIKIAAAAPNSTLICAWGNHGGLHGRDKAVLGMLREAGRSPMALKISKSGQPAHPLYLPYALSPVAIAA